METNINACGSGDASSRLEDEYKAERVSERIQESELELEKVYIVKSQIFKEKLYSNPSEFTRTQPNHINKKGEKGMKPRMKDTKKQKRGEKEAIEKPETKGQAQHKRRRERTKNSWKS